ncbi:MAG: asparagine synthase [Pseudomonadota bacterium]|nr:asparagine synthase [Negativicutes bacterium]
MREGLIPTTLGIGVTATAAALRLRDMKKRGMKKGSLVPMAETALLGFGAAHIVLGAIDMVQHKR